MQYEKITTANDTDSAGLSSYAGIGITQNTDHHSRSTHHTMDSITLTHLLPQLATQKPVAIHSIAAVVQV